MAARRTATKTGRRAPARTSSRSTARRRGRGISIPPHIARTLIGLVLMALGLLIFIPLVFAGGRITDTLRDTIAPWFGTARWILPLLLLAVGAEFLRSPRDSAGTPELTFMATVLAYAGLLGLVGVFAPIRAGSVGRWLAETLSPLVTSPGAAIAYAALLLTGTLLALGMSFHSVAVPLVAIVRRAGAVLFAARAAAPATPGAAAAASRSDKAVVDRAAERRNGKPAEERKAVEDRGFSTIPVAVPSPTPVSATFAPNFAPRDAGRDADQTREPAASVRDGAPIRGRETGADEATAGSGTDKMPAATAGLGAATAVAPRPEYHLPPLTLLEDIAPRKGDTSMDHQRNAAIIEAKLGSFNIPARVVAWNAGPVVTQYEIEPAPEIKVSRIEGLSDDLAMALAARTIRIEAPIPGKSVVGLEIPNKDFNIVALRRILEEVDIAAMSKLTFALGRDVAGHARAADLAKMPHMLIAGATGSGKSVMVNALITSLLCNAKPDEVRFVLVDLKRVELNAYNGLPHLMVPVITEPERAKAALKWAVVEMEHRYRKFAGATARNIAGYNETRADPADRMPYLVIIIDELADLMMREGKNIEDPIVRLAQKARATGIHMVLATQRPSVNVVTGLIKANFPSRIAFAMASQIDSRTILDMPGAEDLIGRGDMLFQPADLPRPMRLQGVFVSDKEISAITDHWRAEAEPHYDMGIIENDEEGPATVDDLADDDADRLLPDAVGVIQEYDRASASLLQRRLKIGYARAARIIDQLEARGYIGAFDGSNARQVLRRETPSGPVTAPDEDDV